MTGGPHRVLVLGGARSGKSAYAESLLAGTPAVTYVATARRNPDDPEWEARIIAHRRRRPEGWATAETLDLAGLLAAPPGPLLLDSVTAWLTGVMDALGAWDGTTAAGDRVAARTGELLAGWASCSQRVVAVSDEVGGGVVPPTVAGRVFRDRLGDLNQLLAAGADEVWLIVAGLPLRLR